MSEHNDCGKGGMLLAFLAGALAGAAVAVLFTPVSGPEARRRLSEFKDKAADSAEEYAHEAKEKISSAVNRGKEFVEGRKSAISSAIEAGKDAYEKEKEKYSKGA